MRNITFEKLRQIKHALPEGSITQIATELNLDEQTVRNYFGAKNYQEGELVEFYKEQGPQGGVVHLQDDSILNRALQIIGEKTVAL
ncbi:MAG: DNA-binding protein [Bacteroidetes bacterium]|nr:DNA-binding protein [Bacteroidota bacterium]